MDFTFPSFGAGNAIHTHGGNNNFGLIGGGNGLECDPYDRAISSFPSPNQMSEVSLFLGYLSDLVDLL